MIFKAQLQLSMLFFTPAPTETRPFAADGVVGDLAGDDGGEGDDDGRGFCVLPGTRLSRTLDSGSIGVTSPPTYATYKQ